MNEHEKFLEELMKMAQESANVRAQQEAENVEYELACNVYKQYDAFIKAGFGDKQAFQLVCIMLSNIGGDSDAVEW